jgi:hypothetical protein
MRSIPVIFSGWNHRAIVAFCRFCKNAEVPFYIVAKEQSDPILLSEYQKNVFKIREDATLTVTFFKEIYKELTVKGDYRLVLMPTTEYLNRFYLSNRKELENIGYVIPLCESNLYDTISDKAEFEKLCMANHIATPVEFSEVSKDNLPFVIKPRNYFFGGGVNVAEKPILIINEDDLDKLGNVDLNYYYCQEFIGGKAFYLLYYFAKDGTYSVYSQKNLAQQHSGLSIVAAESANYHDDNRTEAYTQMFLNCGFRGLVMVEVRDYNGKFYMIEANPRFWGPSQLILDADMNLFDCFALDYGFIDSLPKREYKLGTKYSWFGGIVETSSLNKTLAFHNQYSSKDYLQEISLWLESDVYRRNDTEKIFSSELNCSCRF